MNRMAISELNQAATERAIRGLGHGINSYGQELLSEPAREMLRRAPTLDRWLADFIVKLASGDVVLVDAKFSYARNLNHSIEMRSLLAARREELATYYICSVWDEDGRVFTDFKSIAAAKLPVAWPCCPTCLQLFQSSTDVAVVNKVLPMHCPRAMRARGGSGTPYFVVQQAAFPVYGDPFGFTPPAPQPCRVCGGRVLPNSPWPDCHPACHEWPDAGIEYGAEVAG
jgi:hypothetical protein